MINKWLKAIFTHPIKIIKGNYYRLKNKNLILYLSRYQKCKRCKELENTLIGQVCGICGCPLKSKLRVKEETCKLNKWN